MTEETINPELSKTEKITILQETFSTHQKEYVDNVGDYLHTNFLKIDGFNYQWNSLITSTPLLFEDVDYLRCRQYINNTITEYEIEAYKRGDLRELYATFENLLICNLAYYDRIMNFCTMIFLHYVRISEEELTSQHLDKISYMFDITPTQIWCCALSNTNSTTFELKYGWNINNLHEDSEKTPIEKNWKLLYKNPVFNKFVEYSSLRCGTTGFRQTLISDKTSNRKLSQVCLKFTRTSTAISQEQLNSLYDFVNEQENINQKLNVVLFSCLKKLFNNDETQFACYIFNKEFFIHTSKFSMKVSKDLTGKITKDYLANSYECFAAEESLFDTIKLQIEWARYKLPIQFDYDKQVLSTLLLQMLKENYREILCIKRMNEYGILSRINFQGVFNNLYINEVLMFDNRIIKSSRICLSKENAAKYVIDRGYYLFGNEKDVYEFSTFNRQSLINHYSKYCIPVLQHMQSVISLHNLSKNDIIDVVVSGNLNPNKLNNKNIKHTNMKSSINPKQLMNSMFDKTKEKFDNSKKSYWKAIE